jgi:hypothetical protein
MHVNGKNHVGKRQEFQKYLDILSNYEHENMHRLTVHIPIAQ